MILRFHDFFPYTHKMTKIINFLFFFYFTEEEEEEIEFSCKKCGKSDNPEWMLLCDKCDAGWHASCLRPALMVIPEGDWYCPDCQHSGLIEGLEDKLKSYAALYKSKEGEIKRRERLAFVSMSLQNIIPSSRDKFHPAKANPKAPEKKSAPKKPRRKRSDDDSSSGNYLNLSRFRFC